MWELTQCPFAARSHLHRLLACPFSLLLLLTGRADRTGLSPFASMIPSMSTILLLYEAEYLKAPWKAYSTFFETWLFLRDKKVTNKPSSSVTPSSLSVLALVLSSPLSHVGVPETSRASCASHTLENYMLQIAGSAVTTIDTTAIAKSESLQV